MNVCQVSVAYSTLALVSAAAQPLLRSHDPTPRRREPRQVRSRERVARLLDSASVLVVEQGVEALSTRAIAAHAQVPVASLYQYFADKEGVLLALAERDMAEMDDQLAADIGALIAEEPLPTVERFVRTALGSFVEVYQRRRAFVEIYLRGRQNVAVRDFGRQHNTHVAKTLREAAVGLGVVGPGLTEVAAGLAVDIGDRVFQLAYEVDADGDAALIEEGTRMLIAYLEQYVDKAVR